MSNHKMPIYRASTLHALSNYLIIPQILNLSFFLLRNDLTKKSNTGYKKILLVIHEFFLNQILTN